VRHNVERLDSGAETKRLLIDEHDA